MHPIAGVREAQAHTHPLWHLCTGVRGSKPQHTRAHPRRVPSPNGLV